MVQINRTIAMKQQNFYAIDAAHMLAITAPAEQQLEWNLRALALAEQSPQPRARGIVGSANRTGGGLAMALTSCP